VSESDAASIQLAPGSIFASDFKVIRPLRSGGQGALYVVEQLSTSKLRALKLMLPELVAQPQSRKRFELEAKIAARIQSDHVVESIASGVDVKTSVPWLVMELLEGEDLAALISRRKHLPPAEVLEIFGQLCHALGEAHRQGIVHRDLKPENIFLSNSRRRGMPFMVKVLDFGIARVMAEAKTQSGATVTGLGTPMWMAPEQTIPGGRIEPSTDVWPIGLLVFRMLTGYLFWKAPYDPGASVLMLMAEAFMHPMPAATARAAEYNCADRLPPDFDTWFAKCVARDMDGRYKDAAEAYAALEPLLAAIAGDAPVSSITPIPSAPLGAEKTGPGRRTWEGAPELGQSALISVEEPAPVATADPPAPRVTSPSVDVPVAAPPRRRSPALLGVAALAVLLGAGVFALRRSPKPPPPPIPVVVSAAPVDPPPAASASAAPSADPSVADSASAAPADSASAAPSASAPLGKRQRRLCKAVGKKCFANDDCCDRTCRQWTCRANAALHDPYGQEN
jgi:serine/threonine protein kinase